MKNEELTQEQFLKNVKYDKLKNLSFVIDFSAPAGKKVKMFSKVRDATFTYDYASTLMKLDDIFYESTGRHLEGLKPEYIKSHLSTVDLFTTTYSEPFGLKIMDGIKIYNYYIETDLKLKATELARRSSSGSYNEVIDWKKYPHIAFLYNNVFDPEHPSNVLYDLKGRRVDVLEYVCNLLYFIFTAKQNSSVALNIRSSEHGTGKGTITKHWQRFLGKFSTRIDDKTFSDSFNGIFQNKALTIYDEFNPNPHVNNILKGMIGNDTYSSRSMFTERKEEKNINNFIFTSNIDPTKTYEIETENRRDVFLYSKPLKIVTAVDEHFDLDMSEFNEKIEQEELAFFTDLMRINTSYATCGHKIVTNQNKKDLIMKAHGDYTMLIEAIKKANFDFIENALFEYIDKSMYKNFIEEVRLGYLTKSSITFLSEAIEDEKFKIASKKLGLKLWNNFFGESEKIQKNGTSFIARKLPHFDKNKINLEKKNIETLNVEAINIETQKVLEKKEVEKKIEKKVVEKVKAKNNFFVGNLDDMKEISIEDFDLDKFE